MDDFNKLINKLPLVIDGEWIKKNSNYESGEPTSNSTSSSNSSSNTSSVDNSSSNVSPIIDTGGSRVIFIGDSRTVQMYSYVANTWKNNSYSTSSI